MKPYFFIPFEITHKKKSLPLFRHMNDRKMHSGRNTLPEEMLLSPCGAHKLLHNLLCNTTSQPASLLHWFEVNAAALVPAQPAAQLIGFVSPLLSFPLFFFKFSS